MYFWLVGMYHCFLYIYYFPVDLFLHANRFKSFASGQIDKLLACTIQTIPAILFLGYFFQFSDDYFFKLLVQSGLEWCTSLYIKDQMFALQLFKKLTHLKAEWSKNKRNLFTYNFFHLPVKNWNSTISSYYISLI